MIVLLADGIAVTALAGTAWAINHLPADLPHTLAVQAMTVAVTVIALAELSRFHTNTTGGTHA